MISVRNLNKTYLVGKVSVEAVRDASFDISEGEFVIIHGNSGSGKSTILHLLGLLDEPTKGIIILNKKNVSKLPESEKSKIRLQKMGYIFQEYNILPELTALENTLLPALMTDLHKGAIIKRAEDILKYLGLGKRMSHVPAELSGGEKQRVSIARALINNPEIIFADEPTANVDSATSDRIMDLFKKLNKEFKITIVLVTHNPKYLVYANKVVYIEDGFVKGIKDNKSIDKNYILRRLKDYIKDCIKKGVPKNKVIDSLVKAGWERSLVENFINKINK